MADQYSSLIAAVVSQLSANIAAGTPLKYTIGDEEVDNTQLINLLKVAKDLQNQQPVMYQTSFSNDVSINGDDDTEYYDE